MSRCVGATGLVGETMISVLEERKFPVASCFRWPASVRSASSVSFRGRARAGAATLASFDFAQCDIGLFSAGARGVARSTRRKAAAAGCVVIDNTSQFRYQEDIPLVVPEVNPQAIAQYKHARHHRQSELLDHPDGGGAEADPRCGRHRAHQRRHLPVGLRRRARGRRGAGAQSDRALLSGKGPIEAEGDAPSRSPSTASRRSTSSRTTATRKEEMKMCWETRKILGDAAASA